MKNHNPRQDSAKTKITPRQQTKPPAPDVNTKPPRQRVTQPAEIETEDPAENPASFAGF